MPKHEVLLLLTGLAKSLGFVPESSHKSFHSSNPRSFVSCVNRRFVSETGERQNPPRLCPAKTTSRGLCSPQPRGQGGGNGFDSRLLILAVPFNVVFTIISVGYHSSKIALKKLLMASDQGLSHDPQLKNLYLAIPRTEPRGFCTLKYMLGH